MYSRSISSSAIITITNSNVESGSPWNLPIWISPQPKFFLQWSALLSHFFMDSMLNFMTLSDILYIVRESFILSLNFWDEAKSTIFCLNFRTIVLIIIIFSWNILFRPLYPPAFLTCLLFLSSDKQGTPEEGWRIQQLKRCVSTNNNKDEGSSPKHHIQNIAVYLPDLEDHIVCIFVVNLRPGCIFFCLILFFFGMCWSIYRRSSIFFLFSCIILSVFRKIVHDVRANKNIYSFSVISELIFLQCFFLPELTSTFSFESEWQQVASGPQVIFHYSSRS